MPSHHDPMPPAVEAAVSTPEQRSLVDSLLENGQHHLFADWDPAGTNDSEKRAFLETLATAHRSYPGGLPAYISNARRLLAAASRGDNPYEGCTPTQPEITDLTRLDEAYGIAEEAGLEAFAHTAVVLVAGGLGERLGYHGIKLDIPVETTARTTYLAHYASVLRAAARRCGRAIPLVIMTSRDTDAPTRATLADNHHFGLDPESVTILMQELVPALADVDARLALDGKYRLQLKPHGHGDIHMLLHTSGTARRLASAGIRHFLFIQDTNAQVFNAAFAALGASVANEYDFNSIAVDRVPGEAVGGIACLTRPDAPPLTINVEYNQLDPMIRATVDPRGDVADERGFSRYPGNINLLVIRAAPYLRILESSGGIIAEFVNPKFADASRTTFKKPARLETMMQDLPKLFSAGEKTGVTVFERSWCFSACKNNITDAAAKAASGGPPESASSAESDFYLAGRTRLRLAGCAVEDAPATTIHGIPIVPGPRVILRPSFALSIDDARRRLNGVTIKGDATLVLDGDVHLDNVTIHPGAALFATAPTGATLHLRNLVVDNPGCELLPLEAPRLDSPDVPEFLRIRGYTIEDRGAWHIDAPAEGDWVCDQSTTPVRA
jgi:UDP-sugar pyrophosphorylase